MYDLCGYIIRTRYEVCVTCEACNYQKSYSSLKYATVAMFKTFRAVEDVIDCHFNSADHIFVRESFEEVLIMEYVQIRFHFEVTRYKNLNLSKFQAAIINHKKLSTIM